MKELFKKYWYVFVIVLCIILLCFVVNSDFKSYEIGYLEENEVEEVIEKNKEEEVEETNEEILKEEKTYYYVDVKGEVVKPGVYEISSDSRIIDVIKKAGGLTKNADTSLLNLSKKIKDEMNIKIYSKEEVNNAKNSLNKEPEVIEIIKEIEKECVCPDNNQICNDTSNKNDALIEEDNTIDNITSDEEEKESSDKSESKVESNDKESNKDDNVKLVNINTATKEELMTLNSIGEAKALKIIEYRNKNKFEKTEDILNVPGIGNSIFEKIKNNITV